MFKRNCWTAAMCLGLMILGGADRLWADSVEKQTADLKAKMELEGWKQVSEGVFERQLGPNKVEHLGLGREGLAWTIGRLTRQLEGLMKEQQSYPSEKLSKTIDELSLKIAKAKRELRRMDQSPSQGLSSRIAAVTGPSCSSICYSATADAYPLTSTQGVAATANATFNTACGYSGETYAYAYARATLNGTTTTVTQSDPDSGTSITSSANASVNGGSVTGIPCYSEASSYAQSTSLGISYSTSDTNSSCPVQPCSVTISGTSYEFFSGFGCVSRTWTANVSGCTPTTYQWKYNGTVVGSGSTYTRNVCRYDGTFLLEVTVNGSAYDDHYVTVDYCECGCNGQICP